MNVLIAVGISAALLAATIALSAAFHFPFDWLMILGTALWAAIDSARIELKKYKSGISYGPVALFFGVALLWVVGFPWYLVMRRKIRLGQAELKAEPQDAAV